MFNGSPYETAALGGMKNALLIQLRRSALWTALPDFDLTEHSGWVTPGLLTESYNLHQGSVERMTFQFTEIIPKDVAML